MRCSVDYEVFLIGCSCFLICLAAHIVGVGFAARHYEKRAVDEIGIGSGIPSVIAIVDNLNPLEIADVMKDGGAVNIIQRPAIDKQLVEYSLE